MKNKMKQLFGIILSLVLVLGLMPGTSMTTYAEPVLPPVTISPANAGTVTTGTSGSGNFVMYTFSATPADGYRFVKWNCTKSDGRINTNTSNPWKSLTDNFDNASSYAYYTNVTAVFEEIIPVSSISLDQSAVSLSVGATQTLTTTISPDNATYKTVTWTTSNDSVATVSNGVVTAVAEGTATITVTATNGTDDTNDDKTATCEVTVEPISYNVTYKVVNGTWDGTSTADKKETVASGGNPKSVPTGMKANSGYTGGSWDTDPLTATISADTTFTYTFTEQQSISQTVTFKVVNGSWDDGTTADKIVTLTGNEGDTLKLTTEQIPAVGTKPADSYKAGKWDIVPSSETEITEKVTYTYTYEKKEDEEEDNKITYSNTVGAGSVWTLGSTGTLTFTFSRSENDSETIKHFAGAKVDGTELGSNDYSFKSGSVIIDLKADYLNKLSAGKHTLTAMFDDGDDVTVEFTIKERASEGEKKSDTTPNNKKADVTPGNKTTTKTDAPRTGDTVNIQLIFLVMVLSMCDIFALCNLHSKLDEKKRRR